MRVSASGYQHVERSLALTSSQTLDFRLRRTSGGSGSSGSGSGTGSGARVRYESRNACPCTQGGSTITLRLNGNAVGTLSCNNATRTVSVSPGRHTVSANDPAGLYWDSETFDIAQDAEVTYVMSCVQGRTIDGGPSVKARR